MWTDNDAKGRLEGCQIYANDSGGVCAENGGDSILVACTIRDHTKGEGAYGVYVASNAAGRVTVGADCVFSGNAMGDVFRG